MNTCLRCWIVVFFSFCPTLIQTLASHTLHFLQNFDLWLVRISFFRYFHVLPHFQACFIDGFSSRPSLRGNALETTQWNSVEFMQNFGLWLENQLFFHTSMLCPPFQAGSIESFRFQVLLDRERPQKLRNMLSSWAYDSWEPLNVEPSTFCLLFLALIVHTSGENTLQDHGTAANNAISNNVVFSHKSSLRLRFFKGWPLWLPCFNDWSHFHAWRFSRRQIISDSTSRTWKCLSSVSNFDQWSNSRTFRLHNHASLLSVKVWPLSFIHSTSI